MAQNAAQLGSSSAPLKQVLTDEQKQEIRKRAIDDYSELFRRMELVKKDGAAIRQEIGTWKERTKSDGIDPAGVIIAVKLSRRPAEEVVAEHREVVQNLQLMPGPLGEQFDLFQDHAKNKVIDAYLSGLKAGKNGEGVENNPFDSGTEGYFKWAEGRMQGQKAIAEEMTPPNKKNGGGEEKKDDAAAPKRRSRKTRATTEGGDPVH